MFHSFRLKLPLNESSDHQIIVAYCVVSQLVKIKLEISPEERILEIVGPTTLRGCSCDVSSFPLKNLIGNFD